MQPSNLKTPITLFRNALSVELDEDGYEIEDPDRAFTDLS